MSKIFYISYLRFPSEKAHSLYIAKHCEALGNMTHCVRILVPKRFGIIKKKASYLYNLKQEIVVSYIPCIDVMPLTMFKKVAYHIGLVTFVSAAMCYRWLYIKKKDYIFTSNPIVSLLFGNNVVYEVHDYPEGKKWLYKYIFKKVYRIQTNNYQKVQRIISDFDVLGSKIYAVHNGVTIEDFDIDISQKQAREKLGLHLEEKYVVYTGHLYEWKGVDVFAQAAKYIPDVHILFVGGTTDDVKRMEEKYKYVTNIVFLGHKKHSYISLYQKAADVLVVPNTAKKDISALHTSPMKVFEYMASKRPIIASNIPSICEVLNERNAVLVAPDNPEELALAIKKTIEYPPCEKVQQAFEDVSAYTWDKRADKIMNNLRKSEK